VKNMVVTGRTNRAVNADGMSNAGTGIVFAILAHDRPDCLALQLEILERFAPKCRCLVYDASPSKIVTKQLGVVPCLASQPIHYGRLAPFHIAAMRAAEEGPAYEFLITMDSDVLLLRPGIAAFLQHTMQTAEYMGSHFRRVTRWIRSDSHRRLSYCWKPHWQKIVGASQPYRVLNCFQIFRRALVRRFTSHPGIDDIIEATMPGRTSLVALEEIVYPTLAVLLGGTPRTYPASYSIDTSPVTIARLAELRNDPNAILAHAGTRDPQSPSWQCVRAWSRGMEFTGHDELPRTRRSQLQRLKSLISRAHGDMLVYKALLERGWY